MKITISRTQHTIVEQDKKTEVIVGSSRIKITDVADAWASTSTYDILMRISKELALLAERA